MVETREITDDEWDAHKSTITALYSEYQLPQVMRIMEETYNFSARYALFPTLLILLTDTLAAANTAGNSNSGA